MTEWVQQNRPPDEYVQRRLQRASDEVSRLDAEALVVTWAADRGYLSGCTTGAFIAPGGNLIVATGDVPPHYVTGGVDYEECRDALQPLGFAVKPFYSSAGQNVAGETAAALGDMQVERAAVQRSSVTVEQFEKLRDELSAVGIDLISVGDVIPPLREVKDDWEIAQIERAERVSEAAFEHVLTLVRPGVTEWALAAELEHCMRANGEGSSRIAFQSIVVSGPRSSLPHGAVTHRRLERGDLVTMDFGATFNGYCADITRTFAVGRASSEQRDVYAAVLDGQRAGLQLIEEGRDRTEAARAAVELIEGRGYGDYLAHGAGGHGIGLQVHEGPRTSDSGPWRVGHVCTFEPGVYIPGWGGVRIEDDVVVTEDGTRNLTRLDKELLEL